MTGQRITGLAALACLIIALNAMVWLRGVFVLPVLFLLSVALFCGIVWSFLVIGAAKSRASAQGSAASGVNAVVASVIFLGICMVIFAFVSSWDISLDLTQEGRRDLAAQTVQVLGAMQKEVVVTCYFLRVDDELVLIARDKTLRFLRQCQQYTDKLKIELSDPQVDVMQLQEMGLTSVSPQGTIVVQSGDKQRVISLIGGSPRLEESDFTNALVNVLRNTEPKVAFLTGHSERDLRDEGEGTGASLLGNALRSESYEPYPIEIKLNEPELPREVDILVINNPDVDLNPLELDAIEAFLNRGGRLFVLLDPWLDVTIGTSQREHLRPWLREKFGIEVGGDVVVTENKQQAWRVELRNDNGPFEGLDAGFMEFRGSFQAQHPVTRGFDQLMLLHAARTVSPVAEPPAGVQITPLLRAAPEFWGESDVTGVKEGKPVHHDEGEVEGPVTLAVAAQFPAPNADKDAGEPTDARIIVIGDSDFTSNGGLQLPGHFNFALDAFAWLSSAEDLIAIRPTGKEDPPIVLTVGQRSGVVWVSTLLTLQSVLAAGVVVYYTRRKYR